jgi:hypothetical protein
MPGMSEGLHAKTSAFARRKSTSTASYLGSSLEPIWICLEASLLGSRGTDLTVSAGSKLPVWRFTSGAVTPQVLPWLEPTLALKAVITCGRDLREHIRTLEVLC